MCCFYCIFLHEIFLILTTCYLKSYNRFICFIYDSVQHHGFLHTAVLFSHLCKKKRKRCDCKQYQKWYFIRHNSFKVPIRAQKVGLTYVCLYTNIAVAVWNKTLFWAISNTTLFWPNSKIFQNLFLYLNNQYQN